MNASTLAHTCLMPPARPWRWVRSHRWSLLCALCVFLVGVAGIYAAAASSASTLAASFSTEEAFRHAQAVRFEAATTRATSDRGMARVRCAGLPRMQRDECAAAAGREERIAIRGGF